MFTPQHRKKQQHDHGLTYLQADCNGKLMIKSLERDGNLSQSNQSASSTRACHPSVGRHNEYRPKGGNALRLGSKGRHGSCLVAGKTV